MTSSAVPPARAPLTRREIRAAERAREARAAAEQQDDAAGPARTESVTEPARTRPAAGGAAPAPLQAAAPGPEPRAVLPASRRDLRQGEAVRRQQQQEPATPLPTRRELRETPRRVTRRPEPHGAPVVAAGPEQARPVAPRHERRRASAGGAAERRPAARRPDPAGTPRAWAPRAALLGALGALTIAAPLTGFADPGQGGAAAAQAATPVATQTSLLTTLEAATAGTRAGASSLMAAPAAADRAVVQTSRSVERGGGTCVPGASGTRNALRDVPLVMPIANGQYRLSSPYGSRVDPFTGGAAQHLGSDFSAPTGTPIHAIAEGTVVHAGLGKDGRSSMLIIIEHEIDGESVYSWYVHMYPEGVHVTEGQQVEAGERIGEVGSNGRSTGPHLHLEIHLDTEGTTTDALAWLQDRGAQDVSAVC